METTGTQFLHPLHRRKTKPYALNPANNAVAKQQINKTLLKPTISFKNMAHSWKCMKVIRMKETAADLGDSIFIHKLQSRSILLCFIEVKGWEFGLDMIDFQLPFDIYIQSQ
ncbi:UNVERIFIED_CONTAM: hypothetical protein FKN15_004009 [Acipenser sinensis]